jgi:DNA-binding CsgD family transcriptional regulator
MRAQQGRRAGAIVVIGGDQRVRSWSGEAERISGIRRDRAVGRMCYDVLSLRSPGWEPVCAPECRIAPQAFALEGSPRANVVRPGSSEVLTMWTVAGAHDHQEMIVHVFDFTPNRPAAKLVLTRRQTTVLAMIAEGASTEDIAAALVVSRATVRNHIGHILRRLNVRSRAHAVARAHELGLLP